MKVLRLYHGGRRRLRTQNLGFLIYLEGKKFFHIGDAEETIDNFEPFEWLAKEGIDVAFIPYWFLASREGIEIINRLIKPRHVILMHIPAGDEERVAFEARKVKIGLPSVTVFKSCMEKKNFTE
jgi:L-ascorbate metabolism protein UlaG (beta-lactamase superfamily)